MSQNRQTLTIVVMDVVRSSQLHTDQLKRLLNQEIGNILNTLAPKYGATISKHKGDGFIVGGNDPAEMAEFALQTRHYFRTANWKKMGFHAAPQVRVALNTGPVEVMENGEFSGKHVELASRIEPIVVPDGVWCSATTGHYLRDESDRIELTSLGAQKLAKDSGNEVLFALSWPHELSPVALTQSEKTPHVRESILHRVGVGIPTVKRRFTDKERRQFAEAAFQTVRETFKEALKSLSDINHGVAETEINDVDNQKFTCSAAVQGVTRSRFKVWLATDSWREDRWEIRASTNLSEHHDNSYNYSFGIADNGYRLILDSVFSVIGDRKNLSPEEAARYLWDEFAKRLSE